MGEKLRLIHRRCLRLRLFGLKIDLIEFEFGLSDSARRSVDTPAENIEQIYNRYGVKVFVYLSSTYKCNFLGADNKQ